MQQKNWPQGIRGQVRILLTGKSLERFINEASRQQLNLSHIQWMDHNEIQLTIPPEDFYRLKPLLRQTNTRVRILHKKGLPFLLNRIRKRRFFAWGILLFFILVLSLTSVIWSVDVEGNEKIPDTEIRHILREQGVFTGQLKFRIPSSEEIQYRLTEKLPHASWVGFRIEGTRAIVTIAEKKRVEQKEDKEEKGPVDFIASKDAVIYDMSIKRGRAVVEIHDVVKKGQMLVSGKYGEPDSEKIVGAKGQVLGQVWYESEVTVPLYQKRKVYTGIRETAYFPYLASRMIRFPFLYSDSFSRYETIRRVHSIQLQSYKLPFGWVKEERLEMKWVKQKLTEKEAIMIGVERAKEDLSAQLGEQGRILGEKVLHPRVDNGKVVMKIHFDAVEDIANPQPILQGE